MLFWISNRSSSKQHEIDHVRLCSDLYSTKKFTCSLFCPLSLYLSLTVFVFLIYFMQGSCCRTLVDKLRSLPEVSPPPNSLYNLLLCSIPLYLSHCYSLLMHQPPGHALRCLHGVCFQCFFISQI